MQESLPRTLETKLSTEFDFVIGVDEAGRGPLAGPVVASACVYLLKEFDLNPILGVTDSKQITSEETREMVHDTLIESADILWATCEVDNRRIDEINILQATFEAMTIAVESLLTQLRNKFKSKFNFHIFIDGNKIPPKLAQYPCTALVKGDGKEFVIAAASVIAKVTRDKIMHSIHLKHPEYNFAQHKGYPTADHSSAIYKHGPTSYHRLTFAPLKHMSFSKKKSTKSVSLEKPGKKAISKPAEVESEFRRSNRIRARDA